MFKLLGTEIAALACTLMKSGTSTQVFERGFDLPTHKTTQLHDKWGDTHTREDVEML